MWSFKTHMVPVETPTEPFSRWVASVDPFTRFLQVLQGAALGWKTATKVHGSHPLPSNLQRTFEKPASTETKTLGRAQKTPAARRNAPTRNSYKGGDPEA